MAGTIARRHAQAVFQIALESNEIDRWRSDLKTMVTTLADPQLLAVLENPKVHFSEKMELVNQCLPGVGQLALNLAYLLVARRRLGIIGQIAAEYERLADAHRGVEHAEVVTATPLDEEVKDRLSKHLSSITGSEIILSTRVDPGLVGGFTARVGDRLIDGSTRGRLESLRKVLRERSRE